MSSILLLLPLIYHIFIYLDPSPDPYSEYGYGSMNVLNNLDPDPRHKLKLHIMLKSDQISVFFLLSWQPPLSSLT